MRTFCATRQCGKSVLCAGQWKDDGEQRARNRYMHDQRKIERKDILVIN
jgi:hypothetical protein